MNLGFHSLPLLHQHVFGRYQLIKLHGDKCSEEITHYIILVIKEATLAYIQNKSQRFVIIPVLDATDSLTEGCIGSWINSLDIIVFLEYLLAIEQTKVYRYLNMKAFYPPFLTLSCKTSLSLHHKGVPHSWYFILCSRGYVLGVEPSSCPQDAWLRITQS